MAKFSDGEYIGLDFFVKMLFERVERKEMTADSAHADLMHVLTAHDKGNATEVVPYMQMRMGEWLRADREA